MSRSSISPDNTILENLEASLSDKYRYLNQGSGRILIFYKNNKINEDRGCVTNFNNYYISLSGGTIHVRKEFLHLGSKWLFKPLGDYVEGGSIPFEYYQNLISGDARIQPSTLEICVDPPRLKVILNSLELTENRTRYLDSKQFHLGYYKDDEFFNKIRRGLENCKYLRYGTRDTPFRETNTCINSLENHYREAYNNAMKNDIATLLLKKSRESAEKKLSRLYNHILRTIILHISEEFSNKFNLISGPEYIFRYPEEFRAVFGDTIKSYTPRHILKYIVSSRNTEKSYGMYFLKYNYKNKDIFGEIRGIKEYTILVGMYPLNDENKPIATTSSRELGKEWIGHRYVSLPGYIVKPFDYKEQSAGAAGVGAAEPETRIASDNYNFVGDIYDGVWPSGAGGPEIGRGGAGGAGGD